MNELGTRLRAVGTISRIAFGGSPLGDVFGRVSARDARGAVDAALEQGVTFFDTAPLYGSGRSEERLGAALSDRPRDTFAVATKVGRLSAAVADYSIVSVRRSIVESLRRLQLDEVDVLYVHDVELTTPDVVDEALEALIEARDAGYTAAIGVSGYPLPLLARFAAHSAVDVVLTYAQGCLACDRLPPGPFPEAPGVPVVNAAPLGMGLLTRRGPPTWHPASEAVKRAAREASRVCEEQGTTLESLALEYALAKPGPLTTVVGMSCAAEVEAAVAASQSPPDAWLVARLKRLFAGGATSQTLERPEP